MLRIPTGFPTDRMPSACTAHGVRSLRNEHHIWSRISGWVFTPLAQHDSRPGDVHVWNGTLSDYCSTFWRHHTCVPTDFTCQGKRMAHFAYDGGCTARPQLASRDFREGRPVHPGQEPRRIPLPVHPTPSNCRLSQLSQSLLSFCGTHSATPPSSTWPTFTYTAVPIGVPPK